VIFRRHQPIDGVRRQRRASPPFGRCMKRNLRPAGRPIPPAGGTNCRPGATEFARSAIVPGGRIRLARNFRGGATICRMAIEAPVGPEIA